MANFSKDPKNNVVKFRKVNSPLYGLRTMCAVNLFLLLGLYGLVVVGILKGIVHVF